jgi:uncharacterized membrane protein YoaK (UPF0700 family)
MNDIPRNSKKKYILAWAALGVLFPVIVVLIGRYGHGFGNKFPDFVLAPMIPLIFLAYVLARGGLPAAVVSALVVFLNGALYAGVGWLSWPAFKLLSRDKPR